MQDICKMPWKKKWHSTPVDWPGEFMDRGGWRARVHGLAKEPVCGQDGASKRLITHTMCNNLASFLTFSFKLE